MIEFELNDKGDFIELIKLLKATRIASSGAEAKMFVEDGQVTRNGEPESRKRAKLRSGDIIEIFDKKIEIK